MPRVKRTWERPPLGAAFSVLYCLLMPGQFALPLSMEGQKGGPPHAGREFAWPGCRPHTAGSGQSPCDKSPCPPGAAALWSNSRPFGHLDGEHRGPVVEGAALWGDKLHPGAPGLQLLIELFGGGIGAGDDAHGVVFPLVEGLHLAADFHKLLFLRGKFQQLWGGAVAFHRLEIRLLHDLLGKVDDLPGGAVLFPGASG